MARKGNSTKNKKKVPFAVLRKGALCALLGAGVLAGGVLVGCDESTIQLPAGVSVFNGQTEPNTTDNPGKVGDYYFESDGDIWQLTDDGWKIIGNIKGPTGGQGEQGVQGPQGIQGPQGVKGDTPEITINAEGYWEVDGVDTGVKAEVENPEITISVNGYWEINGVETTTRAKVAEIKIVDGYWYIDNVKQEVKAEAVNGKSAFELAVDGGFDGTLAEWLQSLKGAKGDQGIQGEQGVQGEQGIQGEQGERGYSVVAIAEVVDDKWGISSHFEFTLNDSVENPTVVKTEKINRVMDNYYYGAETEADVLKLIELGAESIELENDIEFTSALAINHNVSFDLNNKTFTYSNGTQIVVDDGIEVEFKDGEMVFASTNVNAASIRVEGGSSLILDRVEYTSESSNILVVESATSVKVVDSKLIGGMYCVSTNALTADYYDVIIDIDDSELETVGYEYRGEVWYDTTAVLINIPCKATIKDSKITGQRQALIVRSGDVVVEDCELINTCKDFAKGLGLDYNEGTAWGTGNSVAMATITVGNDGNTSYLNPTNLEIIDCEIKSKKSSVPAIYAIGNEGADIGTNLVIDTDLELNIPKTIIANNFVNLTFKVDSAKDLLNVAKEIAGEGNIIIAEMSGFAPSIVLTQDINEDIYLSFEDYCNFGTLASQFGRFIVNSDEFDYNVNVYAEVRTALEVAFAMEMLWGAPNGWPAFMVLKNNIDLADIYKMQGDSTITMGDVDMIALLNQYVVRSENGDKLSDYYSISCSLPVEVGSTDELAQLYMNAMLTETIPSAISLTEEVEFKEFATKLIEIAMQYAPENPEGNEGLGEGEGDGYQGYNAKEGLPDMSQMALYEMIPTVDMFLEIKSICTPETVDNLVWEEENDIVTVASYDAIDYAINDMEASSVILFTSINFDTAVIVSREVEVDLNYNSISLYGDTVGDGAFRIVSGGKLTINGEGMINGVGDNPYSIVIWADGGEVIINGGTYTNIGAYSEVDGEHFDVIYVKNGGTATINGGYFMGETPRWILNSHNTNVGTIIVKGGTFEGFDPSKADTNPNGIKNLVAEGYESVTYDDGFTYIVVETSSSEKNNI